MATLNNRENGVRYVQFINRANERRGVPLGRMGKAPAEEIRGHVSALERAALTSTLPPRKTAEWLAEIGAGMHAKLAKVGLVEPREGVTVTTLKAFLDGYIKGRTDLKPRSVTNLEQVRNSIVKFFGAKADIASLTRGQMKDWRRQLALDLSTATASAHVKKARQMFNDAMDRNLITDNPLRGVKAGSQANASRRKYIPVADVRAVIDACPSPGWKLMFALARFTGLRSPSETMELRWSDVNFERSRMVVRSSKTEHHAGRESRVVPIFPGLMPYLTKALDTAPKGSDRVVVGLSDKNARTHGNRLVRRAGLVPWPKTFQNLRVSCEMDLMRRYPLPWVLGWIGHTAQVQREHYNVVPEEAFEAATGFRAAPGAAERTGKDRKQEIGMSENPAENDDFGVKHYPRQGVPNRDISRDFEGIPRSALRRALRRLKIASPREYARAIADMRSGKRGGR